jgi:3-deoxy-D-manno-octulosonic-acid transferase
MADFTEIALKTFDYFFVQNESSKKLLQSLGYQNVKFLATRVLIALFRF